MSTPPAGIPEADWLTWPPEARAFILAQQQEIEQLRSQLTALASELALPFQAIETVNESPQDRLGSHALCQFPLPGVRAARLPGSRPFRPFPLP
jgi:hypothetical protein